VRYGLKARFQLSNVNLFVKQSDLNWWTWRPCHCQSETCARNNSDSLKSCFGHTHRCALGSRRRHHSPTRVDHAIFRPPFGCIRGEQSTKCRFGGTVCKTVRFMLSDRWLSVVCNVDVLWPNGWMDYDATCLGLGPDHIVLDGDPALPQKGAAPNPVFGLCLLWPNGWTDQDATWYGDRFRPRATMC